MDTKPYYQKYAVRRNDGRPLDDNAEWFVLMIHDDRHARIALRAYAESAKDDAPELSLSLFHLLTKYEGRSE